MFWLVCGVVLWSGLHLLPSAGASVRARAIDRIGPAYQGVFALGILASVGLMVLGWRSTPPSAVYTTPTSASVATNVLLFAAIFLMAASGIPSNVKRVIRHPQLTGFATWGVAHLLSNGDLRSLVLFGGLTAWAIAAIFFINRRDGAWEKPEAEAPTAILKPLIAAVVGFVVLYLAHPYIAGVPPTPRF